MHGWIVRVLWRAVAISLLVAGSSAELWAQEEDYGRQRPYVGVGLAYAEPNFDGYDNSRRDAHATFGLDVRAGYRWRYVAAEVNYQLYRRFDLSGTEAGGDFQGMTLGPNVKAYPLGGRFQPYALIGGGWQHYNNNPIDSDNAGMLRFGGGIEVYFMESVALFAEVTYVLGISSDLDAVPVVGGIQIHM